MTYSGEMGWSRCDPNELPGLLEARTHEVTSVHDWEWGTIGLAAPRNEGENVDPNQVFIDAFASGIVNDAIAGGRHARTSAELSLDGMVAAFVTQSRLATGREQQSIMEGDLPPLGRVTGPTLGQRFAARNGTDPQYSASWVAAADTSATIGVTPLTTRALSGPTADLPVAPRLADACPVPAASPDRPVNPCDGCVFAGGLEEFAQDNASVTILDGKAVVRFMEGEGDQQRISGAVAVALPASSRHWSQPEITQYVIGKVLDGTRRCSDNGRGNVSISRGFLGIMGISTGCSGLVDVHPTRNRLVPNAGFTYVGDSDK